jgi:glutamine synthetase
VELRSPDGSADIYSLMAGLAVAARHGLEMKNAIGYAERTYVDVNIFSEKNKKKKQILQHLPSSCWESAQALENHKNIYLEHQVFTQGTLNGIIAYLKSFNDQHLRNEIKDDTEKLLRLVSQYFHCG